MGLGSANKSSKHHFFLCPPTFFSSLFFFPGFKAIPTFPVLITFLSVMATAHRGRFNPVPSFSVCILTTPQLHSTELFLKVQIFTCRNRYSFSSLSQVRPFMRNCYSSPRERENTVLLSIKLFLRHSVKQYQKRGSALWNCVVTLFLQFFQESHKLRVQQPKCFQSSKLAPAIYSPGISAQPQSYLTGLEVWQHTMLGRLWIPFITAIHS